MISMISMTQAVKKYDEQNLKEKFKVTTSEKEAASSVGVISKRTT